ncbi:MAG: phenylacetate--CoA ligase family protein, partial [Halobacteriovoraceae bacterium]|nr:phenylacetate--CoA ligase family protein [Halobacteriovoraceae bacterium]
MITSYSIDEIIEYASTNSPFYRELYSGVSKPKLRNLPVLDQAPFWKALGDDKLLTANSRDGVVFKSGGTTGNPKHSYFNREEWESFCHIFGTGMSDNLREGDR